MHARFDARDETCLRLGGFRHGQAVTDDAGHEFVVVGVKPLRGKLRLWLQPTWIDKLGCIAFIGDAAAALRASPPEDAAGTRRKLRESSLEEYDAAEDSDGEQVQLCRQCHLPLGELAYKSSDETPMHGECLAQFHVRALNEKELARRQKDAAVKQQRHAEHGIGWDVQQIPRNLSCAAKLQSSPVPQHMCCLTLDESGALHIAATMEPSAAVNLEYLATALQVRRQEGKDALFSLDPLEPSSPADGPDMSLQRKRFEPSWLAGTSMGEVMFQADYHLKALSMGEYEQPVLGMKSCFDLLSAGGGKYEKDWSAREWFVVRQADVFMSEDDVLIPYVKMGIEAREQVMGADGLQDAPITRGDHPLVQYAKEFTHNFDLIAERKSVIYHLREVAKSAVLAKYLVENEAQLGESWLRLAGADAEACCMEVPQLWNERLNSEIRVQDGKIMDAEETPSNNKHGVYGGVDFGIDKFRMSGVPAAAPIGVSFGLDKFSLSAGKRAAVRPTLSGTGVATRMSALFAVAPMVAGVRAPVMGQSLVDAGQLQVSQAQALRGVGLRGVDLNLDQFDLSGDADGRVAGKWASSLDSVEARAPVSGAFWSSIEDASRSAFRAGDARLLADVFHPRLSDRREEGDKFVPPETSRMYIEQLRNLVKEEEGVQEARRGHFLSKAFKEDGAGPLFPSSWQASCQIAHAHAAPGLLHARPDFEAQAATLGRFLKAAEPAFDKATEDGTHFRIYRIGSLEARTIQATHGEEVIGAVFSVRSPQQASREDAKGRVASEREEVVKVTEFVEGAEQDASMPHSYVVLETSCGNAIVTERLPSGASTWEENPSTLEVRNSFAKVLRSVDCDLARAAVRDIRTYQSKSDRPGNHTSASKCKRYARNAYDRAQALHLMAKTTAASAKSD